MNKYRLATPGPTMVPEEVLLELARPVRHHRTVENKACIKEAISGLKTVFATAGDVVILTSSGTGAMEMAVGNFVRPGDKTVVLSSGKWGERWQELNRAFGADAVVVEEPNGKAIRPERVGEVLASHPDAVAVFGTLSETSTGVENDVAAIGSVVAKSRALWVVDGISGVGACRCLMDDWNIDLLVVGSQKALMLPPGLAFLGVSTKAKAALAAVDKPPTYYFNLARYLKSTQDFDTPFTPAHTLIAALTRSLKMLLALGMETVWREADLMARAMRAAAQPLELELFAERPAAGLTVYAVPAGINGEKWEKLLETKYQLKVAGGQGSLKGKIIRISHMGYTDPMEIVGIVAALEWTLLELGHPIRPGDAVARVSQVFAEELA